jgi:hypothetical protein
MSTEDSNTVTPLQLGEMLYNLCDKYCMSISEVVETHEDLAGVDKGDIDRVELAVAFMWSCFDLLQAPEYQEPLTHMHKCFLEHIKSLGMDVAAAWETVGERYETYSKDFRSHENPDYKNVAPAVRENILKSGSPDVNSIMEIIIATHLANNIINIGENLKSIKISDSKG